MLKDVQSKQKISFFPMYDPEMCFLHLLDYNHCLVTCAMESEHFLQQYFENVSNPSYRCSIAQWFHPSMSVDILLTWQDTMAPIDIVNTS